MDYRLAKFAAAGAVVGILGMGTATLASAQDDGSTSSSTTTQAQDDSATTAPAPSTDSTAKDGKDCPLHDAASDTADTSAAADTAS